MEENMENTPIDPINEGHINNETGISVIDALPPHLQNLFTAEGSAIFEDMAIEDLEVLLGLINFFVSLMADGVDFSNTWGFDSTWSLGHSSYRPSRPATPSYYSRRITNIEEMHRYGVTNIRETHRLTEDYYFITRIVRLPFNAPQVIRLNGFTLDGLSFEFVSLAPVGEDGITFMNYTTIVELQTYSSDMSQAISEFPRLIHHATDEGYIGIMHLEDDSITIAPAASEWVRTYLHHVAVYNNIPFGDTSNFATFFIENGIAFSVHEIDWQVFGEPETYGVETILTNPVVTYRGWYSTATIPYFTAQATYHGVLQNFEHFPSALYEVHFAASLAGVRHTTGTVLPGLEHVEVSSQQEASEVRDEANITGAVVIFIVLAFLALLFAILNKLGIFKKFFGKKEIDEDDYGDIEDEDDEDHYN